MFLVSLTSAPSLPPFFPAPRATHSCTFYAFVLVFLINRCACHCLLTLPSLTPPSTTPVCFGVRASVCVCFCFRFSNAKDAYMAPELMYGNPYGTSADMFSFGIVLWETIYRQKVCICFVRAVGRGKGGKG